MQVCSRFPSPCRIPSKPRIAIRRSLSKDAVHHFDRELKTSTANLKNALLKQKSYPLFGEVETRQEGAERHSSDHTESIVEDDWHSERVLLVGISSKRTSSKHRSLQDSLTELASLAKTAGLQVMSHTQQVIESPNPATFIGSGKVQELKEMVRQLCVSTVIFDEELSPVQLLNLERELDVRICDRTALILDIFSQQARSKEGKLQIELAMCNYQFPRLTRMWTHLERQTGGAQAVKGMGEKQIEIDKRILQKRINVLSRELEEVKLHRRLARLRRAQNEVPVVGLVGYTNAGKSTLLNELTEAEVFVEDKLFATLDPTTRRLKLPTGKTALLSDTVGFIQKLPHQLLAAFSATLEELQDSSLLLHVIDISSPHALQQASCVESVLTELDLEQLPLISVWNKFDQVRNEDRDRILKEANEVGNTFCVSLKTGEGIVELLEGIEKTIEESMVPCWFLVPYSKGHVIEMVYSQGVVKSCSHLEDGTLIEASVPIYLAKQLQELQIDPQGFIKETKLDEN